MPRAAYGPVHARRSVPQDGDQVGMAHRIAQPAAHAPAVAPTGERHATRRAPGAALSGDEEAAELDGRPRERGGSEPRHGALTARTSFVPRRPHRARSVTRRVCAGWVGERGRGGRRPPRTVPGGAARGARGRRARHAPRGP